MCEKGMTWYKNDPKADRQASSLRSPLCFVTWGHQPLRRAHWLSASAGLRIDTPLPCQINNEKENG